MYIYINLRCNVAISASLDGYFGDRLHGIAEIRARYSQSQQTILFGIYRQFAKECFEAYFIVDFSLTMEQLLPVLTEIDQNRGQPTDDQGIGRCAYAMGRCIFCNSPEN